MSDTYLSVASSTDLVYKTITSDSVAGSEDLIALTPLAAEVLLLP